MPLIQSITSLSAHAFDVLTLKNVVISAMGEVATSGWTHVRLTPRYYAVEPADGILEFDLIGDAPTGIVATVVLPVGATGVFPAPKWVKGVRVYASGGSMESRFDVHRAPLAVGQARAYDAMAALRANPKDVVVRQELAVYDDSFQPTGTIHWHGLVPHAEMKKLRHTLVLNAGGPDEAAIRNCINQATTAGLIAGIIAACATGGAAVPAAVAAFLAKLQGCLGAGFFAKIDDESHWIYWDT